MQKTLVQSLGREDAWRRKWQPTPVFLSGKFHGQRSLAGYSPWGPKESDMTYGQNNTSRLPEWSFLFNDSQRLFILYSSSFLDINLHKNHLANLLRSWSLDPSTNSILVASPDCDVDGPGIPLPSGFVWFCWFSLSVQRSGTNCSS